jgi:N-acetyl-gamma-glutamylphosphate reductase
MPTIGITGAAGQLGQEFAFLSQYHPKYDFVFLIQKSLILRIMIN